MEWLDDWQQEENIDDMQAVIQAPHQHHHQHHHGNNFHSPIALDRRSTAGSSSNGPAASSANSFRSSYDGVCDGPGLSFRPNAQSSPSVVSSLNYSSVPGGWSPLYRQPSSTPSQSQATIPRDSSSSSSRHGLARRLTLLAQRLACGDDIDMINLAGQLELMENAVSPPASPSSQAQQTLQNRRQQPPLASRSDPPRSPPSRSEAESVLGSPASLIRSQFSDLSLASLRQREREREQERIAEEEEEERETRERPGISEAQAERLVAETNKLNEELSQVAENLLARREEMDHINNLLVERTERAAERIVFLQNRVSYLEQELDDNDDELQHLRICMKAVEIQMPPNPDDELQRCIDVFKEEFRQVKRNRAIRASMVTATTSQKLAVSASAPTTPHPGVGGKRSSAAPYKLYN